MQIGFVREEGEAREGEARAEFYTRTSLAE